MSGLAITSHVYHVLVYVSSILIVALVVII